MHPHERLGILGGTFNPVHVGHLIMAQNALELFDLSRVLFIPSNIPPHKTNSMLPGVEHRLAMLESALEDELLFDVCDLEIDRGGTSYTVDTLRHLKRVNPGADLYFIIGSDTLTELHSWRNIYTALSLATFVTLSRPGSELATLKSEDLKLDDPWPARLLENVATGRLLDISSSDIRHRVAEGLSVRYLVPPGVEMYIAEHKIYG